jgi:ABC-type nitrate/sulfonate/bicarbonate transport system permease component
MVEAQSRMETSKVIAYMIIAGLIGFLIDAIMVLIERILLKWKNA